MRSEQTPPVPPAGHKIGLVNSILIVLLVALPTIFGLLDKAAEMGVIIVACALSLCFANLDKIESVKGAGFEARIREAAKIVEGAYATVEKLQKLALPVVRANIANITYGGRWSGIGREKEHELVRQFTELATSLDVQDDPEVMMMTKDFYDHQIADHITFILEVMNRAHIKNDSVKARLGVFLERTDDWAAPSVATIRSAMAELAEDQKLLLEPFILDYEHYVMTCTHRRIEATSYQDLPAFERASDGQ